MDKQELIDEYLKITDVNKDIGIIYGLMDKLGIKYKRTNCKRCRNDYKLMIAEQLDLIDSAADESDFNSNSDYIYIPNRPCIWNGQIINQNTPVEVIREFVKKFPNGYYKINNKTE